MDYSDRELVEAGAQIVAEGVALYYRGVPLEGLGWILTKIEASGKRKPKGWLGALGAVRRVLG